MMSVSQVTKLTGVSSRTLQYYDEIGLLKPSELTIAGYRLYNEEALQKLQQILFFKEFGFKLREINEFINQQNFDRIEAYKKQKELLLLKRNRTDRLIQLLDRLEKGEQCMSFKEFDLTDYMNALEDFKQNNTDDIVKYWGDVENFNLLIQKVKEDESNVAKRAIKEFGSVEKYTEAMKYNLEHFSEIMEKQMTEDVKEVVKQNDELYTRLTADMSRDISSDEIQQIVQEIYLFMHKHSSVELIRNSYLNIMINSYSSDYVKAITDTKYGIGASAYIVKTFQFYMDTRNDEE
ncbi:MAG: MerR family transcriptional regulator [Candidatus Galacturonibacter soehngenii]|nr:MerR family transcriptional regulator [Candidatus Galacturonibacter soehngenii]